MGGPFILQQNRRTLAFIIAEIGTMLGIARERRQFGRKMPRDIGGIGEPQILIGLEPAKAVADQHAEPQLLAGVRASAMRGRSEEADSRPRITFSEYGLAKIFICHSRRPMTVREDERHDILRREGKMGRENV